VKALVTRPAEDAASLIAALAARGVEPVLEPLARDPLCRGRRARLAPLLHGVQALLFTSANGVRAFAGAVRTGPIPPPPSFPRRRDPFDDVDPRLRGTTTQGDRAVFPAARTRSPSPSSPSATPRRRRRTRRASPT